MSTNRPLSPGHVKSLSPPVKVTVTLSCAAQPITDALYRMGFAMKGDGYASVSA